MRRQEEARTQASCDDSRRPGPKPQRRQEARTLASQPEARTQASPQKTGIGPPLGPVKHLFAAARVIPGLCVCV